MIVLFGIEGYNFSMSDLISSQAKTESELPAELDQFNWGAFLLTWIWGIGHRVWIALTILGIWIGFRVLSTGVLFIPGPFGLLASIIFGFLEFPAEIGFAIWLGLKGNQLAWKTGRYNDVEKYKVAEKKWTIAGIILWVSLILIFLLLTILINFIGVTSLDK